MEKISTDGAHPLSTGPARVMVVDDDEVICRAIAEDLSNAGYELHTALDGRTAIEQAESTPPDVAIIDLGMPTSGFNVLRHLRDIRGPSVHLIVMTGHDDEAHRHQAFDAGADDYVVKPTSLRELRRRVGAGARKQAAYVETRLAKEAADRRMAYGSEASALLAHDLNNGLAVALSNLEFIAEEGELEGETSDALLTSVRSLRRMSGLVANFVDIARFEDAAVKPKVSDVSVVTVLRAAADMNAALITRGVTIQVECSDELRGRFDAALVERVLHNLIGNATRYCNAGGLITVLALPTYGAQPESGEHAPVTIVVHNTGPEIGAALRETLFGKYVRGSGGKRGMGLYFCRLVAEAHGGRITYGNHPSVEGASFVVELPGRA